MVPLFLGLTALLLGSCGGAPEPATRIVLVTLDTLRADSLSDMPRTRALLEEGVLFTDFYASTATTQPTHASLLTGLHPWDHGVTRNAIPLAERFETVPERLQARGFTTSAIVASFPLERRFGLAQGFDRYDDAFEVPYVRQWEGEQVAGGTFYTLAESVTDRAIEELVAAKGERQFFWFHYFDPHDPYGDAAGDPTSEWMDIGGLLRAAASGDAGVAEQVLRARSKYDADVAALDRALGRLYDALALDERFETHLFVTADHGESFGELGCLGHGKRMTREQVQVPLICVSPDFEPGERADTAGSVDVAVTLLSLGGGGTAELSGRDLSVGPRQDAVAYGMRRGEKKPGERERLLDGSTLAVGGPAFFLVRGGKLEAGDGSNVRAEDDPARPLEGESAARVRALFAKLEERLANGGGDALVDPEVERGMGALGY